MSVEVDCLLVGVVVVTSMDWWLEVPVAFIIDVKAEGRKAYMIEMARESRMTYVIDVSLDVLCLVIDMGPEMDMGIEDLRVCVIMWVEVRVAHITVLVVSFGLHA